MVANKRLGKTIARVLREVDWPRVAHRVGLLVRELRGDDDIDHDHQRERMRGAEIKSKYGRVARSITGCSGEPDCDCGLCVEEREANE